MDMTYKELRGFIDEMTPDMQSCSVSIMNRENGEIYPISMTSNSIDSGIIDKNEPVIGFGSEKTMFDIQEEHTLFSGQVFICDPCYIISDNNWLTFCDENPTDNREKSFGFTFNGVRCAYISTNSGDGCFTGYKVNGSICVDSGLIAVFPIDVFDGKVRKSKKELESLGSYANIGDKGKRIFAYCGDFKIGDIQVFTGGDLTK